ncbi:MAG: glutamyl-tRNA(Gln) amidotransferase subunit A [Patescibacteria group bacterium]|nr:MAG: glutamyl-tRNA(Gln) amidotransferase subunit A [Patescibacteria group bacterium]
MTDILGLGLLELKKLIEEKKISYKEVFDYFIARIKKHNPKLNAYITVCDKQNEDKLPIAVKDNFCTKGIRTTAASKVLDNFVPNYNAEVIDRLLANNFSILGKTNMDAWAHGSSTETSDYGPTKNPWNLDHIPGGSSGGSGAVVSAYLAPAAIGSETAGSIRQPAGWCGVIGFKPTYGRISRFGLIAMASSFDCPGPMTLNVQDAAYLLGVLSGQDKKDATTVEKPPELYFEKLAEGKKLVIGIPEEYFDNIQKETAQNFEKSKQVFNKLGFKFKKIKLISPEYAISVYTIIQRAEVASNLSRFDGIRFGNTRDRFGFEAKKRIMLGNFVLSAGYYSAFYQQAQKLRQEIKADFARVFSEVDLILAPVVPSTALKLGEFEKYPFFGELIDKFNEPAAIAGLPAVSFPTGFDNKKLPTSLQLIGNYLDELRLLQTLYKFQQETNYFDVIKLGVEKWK